jgi:hypothetical protein
VEKNERSTRRQHRSAAAAMEFDLPVLFPKQKEKVVVLGMNCVGAAQNRGKATAFIRTMF